MKRGKTGRRAAAAICAIAACAAAGCTALGPAGRGGWTPERRASELEQASAITAGPSPAPLARSLPETPFVPSAPAAPRKLDLDAALALAHRHNRSIGISDASVDIAAGNVAVARAALLPTASVHGSYNWFSDEQSNTVDFGGQTNSIVIREQDFASVNAAARLAIDLSGELRHGLYSAQASFRAERARAWATRLQEESSVAAAYFGLLEAERLRDVELQTVALHERQFADASNRFEQGRLTRNGVLVVQVALIDARQLVVRLDNSVAAARRSLNSVTGLEIGAPTAVVDVSRPPGLPPLDEAVAAVTRHNPLVTSMLEEVQSADERLTAARRARFPRFQASGGYDATTQDTITPNNYGSLGIGVDVDLYSFAREGDIARLEATVTRSRLLLDRTRRDVETMVRDAHDRVRERVQAIDAATAAVSQAEENLRIRQVQFDEGRATSEDLLDAAQLLTRQRAALASAIYESHVSRAQLQQLMGEPLTSEYLTSEPPAGEHPISEPLAGEHSISQPLAGEHPMHEPLAGEHPISQPPAAHRPATAKGEAR
ncbi:MAG TPA: TolC family protein [Candidatus Limnocylindrales bacterium]|nr:TolC family protein [Candidatus Limnocylindrales bacterium]